MRTRLKYGLGITVVVRINERRAATRAYVESKARKKGSHFGGENRLSHEDK
jgi:hypothetical protein